MLTKQFEKSYKKFTSKDNKLKTIITEVLFKIETDAFHTSLKTHKLSGKLVSYLAWSCGFDCRIIFVIKKDISNSDLENIISLDIGRHDEVY